MPHRPFGLTSALGTKIDKDFLGEAFDCGAGSSGRRRPTEDDRAKDLPCHPKAEWPVPAAQVPFATMDGFGQWIFRSWSSAMPRASSIMSPLSGRRGILSDLSRGAASGFAPKSSIVRSPTCADRRADPLSFGTRSSGAGRDADAPGPRWSDRPAPGEARARRDSASTPGCPRAFIIWFTPRRMLPKFRWNLQNPWGR